MAVEGFSRDSVLLLLLSFFGFYLRSTYGDDWRPAHATFYASGATTMGGACGYYNVDVLGYGQNTAALSSALFNNGFTCGACYQIKCSDDPKWCLSGSITVTATNLCPQSNKPNNNGGWCNPPLEHFDLAPAMFKIIAKPTAGIVPVQYMRVACQNKGGIKLTFNKNPNLVLIANVGGIGDVRAVSVGSSSTGPWTALTRNWGQNWNLKTAVEGQSVSFKVTTSDGKSVICKAPSGWQFGSTYDGGNQF